MAEISEADLRPKDNNYAPFEPKCIDVGDGRTLVFRQVDREEAPILLEYIAPLVKVQRDFYDIVAARTYAEILGYIRYRVQDEYVLVGQVDGELVNIVNGRQLNRDVGVSYHTLAVKRGMRAGAHGFATKMEYHLDALNQKEVLIVAESPIGFRRWMETYGLAEKFDTAHELGGVPTYTLTKEIFEKAKSKVIFGSRPVPADLLAKAQEKILPPTELPK